MLWNRELPYSWVISSQPRLHATRWCQSRGPAHVNAWRTALLVGPCKTPGSLCSQMVTGDKSQIRK